MFKIKPLKTEKDYEETLKAIEKLWDSKPNSPEEATLEVLVTLVEKYEDTYFPIEEPDPIEAIKFIMEQQQLKRKDLEEILGSRSRVSEILNKQRKLSLPMMRKLHQKLKIPYEALIADYKLKTPATRKAQHFNKTY